jgi:hypothetical protein
MNCRARDTWSRQPTIRLDEESPSAEPSSNPTPRRPVVESNGACEILWSSGLTISCTTDWRNVTWRSEAKLYSSTGKGEKSSDTALESNRTVQRCSSDRRRLTAAGPRVPRLLNLKKKTMSDLSIVCAMAALPRWIWSVAGILSCFVLVRVRDARSSQF